MVKHLPRTLKDDFCHRYRWISEKNVLRDPAVVIRGPWTCIWSWPSPGLSPERGSGMMWGWRTTPRLYSRTWRSHCGGYVSSEFICKKRVLGSNHAARTYKLHNFLLIKSIHCSLNKNQYQSTLAISVWILIRK